MGRANGRDRRRVRLGRGAVGRGGRGAVLLLALLPLLLAGVAGAGAQEATPAAEAGGVAAMLPEAGPLPEGEARSEGPLVVVATTGILADLVAQVGGQRVAVRSLLPANADPHDFEPAPADLVAVEEADLIVRHGLHLDDWAETLIGNAETAAPVVVATEGIATLAAAGDEAAEFEEGDPHVWFDPRRTAQMVENIRLGMTAADPDGATTYQSRANAYGAQLSALDAAIGAAVGTVPAERRKLVTNHDALAYYAERYGLEVVGTVIPSLETTAEPSAREAGELLATIAAEGVPVIFAENTTSPGLAEALAEEAGVAIVDDLYTDSLGAPGSGAETYLGLMRTDTIVIVEALK
jgi:zinc/manganese transport system substrate-binding protein